MRLWSIHPKYLDRQGLLAVWREGLLAQKVLLQGKYKKCYECLGTGRIGNYHNVICYNCKGKKRIKTPYYNHSQLLRFKELDTIMNSDRSIRAIGCYLYSIWHEANKRGYKFNIEKIIYYQKSKPHLLTVTTGQLVHELIHLYKKLEKRDKQKYDELHDKFFGNIEGMIDIGRIEPHPLFKVIEGDIESWEKIK